MWTSLHNHTDYSLLDGLSKPDKIAKVCVDNGYKSCAITDHGSISGAVAFSEALRGVCANCGEQKKKHKGNECPNGNTTFSKAELKPILGCELYVPEGNAADKENFGRSETNHLVVLAKNPAGWKQLITAVSHSNDDDVFYYKPRLDLDMLSQYLGDMIGFSGHLGSHLAKIAKTGVVSDVVKSAKLYEDRFGKGNFFIEIQRIDIDNCEEARIISEVLREASKISGIPCVATGDSHYPTKEDAADQRVLLCSAMKTTFSKVRESLQENKGLSTFFKSTNFNIPTFEEISIANTEEEIDNALLIESMCEDYDITSPPELPVFDCGTDNHEHLTQLCRNGWTDNLVNRKILNSSNKQVYTDRIREELQVIKDANLAGYFLVVNDYINWTRSQGWLVGPGRGSGAGSLVSYLLGITMIDPIPHGLLFSRFYNPGRNTKDRVELPDIDTDFPVNKRKQVIEYIKDKYGHNNVAQICTFGGLKGRSALKEVLRVHGACDFGLMNKISNNIPKPEKIADQLQDSGETSTILWSLKYEPDLLSDYCRIDDDGDLSGEYAQYFEQAIRLENTLKSTGVHAAGIVITGDDINTLCPMIKDKKGGDKLVGWEMNHAEATGRVKFDILGVNGLDKLMGANDLLEKGVIDEL